MLEKLQITFRSLAILLLLTCLAKADLIKPNKDISPKQVVEIQLKGLMNNDKDFTDSGIEQTWNFAHPTNKQVTGPLPRFKTMLKGKSYSMTVSYTHLTLPTILLV